MEDAGQDGPSSPATPGAVKSKLDTLAKEDLIKFAKKQMLVIQKVKGRCTDLEKEIAIFKAKLASQESDDVVQALTQRLDSVLLEKAETQQQLVIVKKEYAKTKHEAEEAEKKISDVETFWKESNNSLLKEVEVLKLELQENRSKQKEEVDSLKGELRDALEKLHVLSHTLHESQESGSKRLEEETQRLCRTYEEQILNLDKSLQSITEEKKQEIAQLREALTSCSEQHNSESQNLHDELVKLRTVHQEEVSDLMNQLETVAKQCEIEKEKMHSLVSKHEEKEKRLIEEEEAIKEKYEHEIRLLREKMVDGPSTPDNDPLENETVKHLKSLLIELESQHSILKDELTYTNNMKIKLELEVQQLKSEYFHEREELEFKINELQLAIEDYHGLIEKLKSQLQTTKIEYERLSTQNKEEIQAMRAQHKKEIAELKQTLTSHFESETSTFAHEIKVIKEQCDKLQQEKEEAVSNYESIRETLVSFQTEIGESAGKISQEFKAMKEQQATDVQKLQEKLRAAYKDKNDLMETVNRLKAEAEILSSKQTEFEELRLQISHMQQKNEEVMTSLCQKEEMLKDMEIKMSDTTLQNTEMASSIKLSSEEISKLQEMCKSEEARSLTIQQELEAQAKSNANFKQMVDELTKTLQESESSFGSSQTEIKDLQEQLDMVTLYKQKKNTEESRNLTLQQEFDAQSKCNAHFKQTIDDLTNQLQESVTSKDQLQCEIKHLQEQLDMLGLDQQKMKLESQKDNEEESRNLTLQQEFDAQANCNAHLKQTIDNLTIQLQESVTNKDESRGESDHLREQLDMLVLEKQKMELELQRVYDEVLKLNEEKNVMIKDFERLMTEHSGCLILREELGELKIKMKMLIEGKEQITKLLESEKQQMEAVKCQIVVLTEALSIEDAEQDLTLMLQDINAGVCHVKEEKQHLMRQVDEKSAQFERFQEEFESQCTELRALLSDYSKEKELLTKELEETLADKEALQRDLLEMKIALEKAKFENQDLASHTEKITADLDEQDKTETSLKVAQEAVIHTLTLELASVKDLLSKSNALELEQQASLTDLQHKLETLKKESSEKEERSNKIKAVAVKAKRELDANKKEVQSTKEELEKLKAERDQLASAMKDLVQSAEGYRNLLLEYDRQTEEVETMKGRANNADLKLEDLSRQLQVSALVQAKLTSANEDYVARLETLQSNIKLLEAQILEMQRAKTALDKELEAEKLLKEQKIKDHNGAQKQVEELQTQLQKERKHLQKTMQELELVRKDAQQSTLMDMEIADYDRLVKELNQKITNKNSQVEDLEQEARIQKQKQEMLQEEILSLQAAVDQHGEQTTKMKQLLVKTKKELADAKEAESSQLILQASLKGEFEAIQQQLESYKIQTAELMSEKHKVHEQLRTVVDQHQRATNAYQQTLSSLKEECTAAKAEQATVTAEFESYKVRVHNVLKQQKNKSASQAEQEGFKQEREHLQTMLDQVKVKLQETQQNLQLNVAELQSLQSEHDTLLEMHNKMLQETIIKEAELREKLCATQSENVVLKTEHAHTVSQLTAQIEAQSNSARDQVRHLQDDHRKTVEMLRQQLSKAEAQLLQIKSESTNPTSSQKSMKGLGDRRTADLPLLDLYAVAREEGEGMETTDTESLSSASTQVGSLEQLLSSPEPRSDKSAEQLSKEELAQKLNTTSKSVDHLSALLHETEATNAILMEQITLLKNEIRRLERNQEREKSVANLEYLKNVLLQFIFLKAGSEKERLLPVIDTMLQLSPEEKGKLFAIAQGEEEAASHPAGWASYLHSWSGLR
ncbi:GRIP and coiled-coil domain-containing protein 2 [Pelodytes ibericus]